MEQLRLIRFIIIIRRNINQEYDPKTNLEGKKELIISIVFEEGKNVQEKDIIQLAALRIKSYISSGIEI